MGEKKVIDDFGESSIKIIIQKHFLSLLGLDCYNKKPAFLKGGPPFFLHVFYSKVPVPLHNFF